MKLRNMRVNSSRDLMKKKRDVTVTEVANATIAAVATITTSQLSKYISRSSRLKTMMPGPKRAGKASAITSVVKVESTRRRTREVSTAR